MQIDLNDVVDIFFHCDPETEFYYSIPEEEIHQVLECEVDGVYDPELAEAIQNDSVHYFHLPQLTDDIRYEYMSEFVRLLPEGRPKYMLFDALDDRSAYERFDEYVTGLGLEDRWNSFFVEQCTEYIKEWCLDKNTEIEFV